MRAPAESVPPSGCLRIVRIDSITAETGNAKLCRQVLELCGLTEVRVPFFLPGRVYDPSRLVQVVAPTSALLSVDQNKFWRPDLYYHHLFALGANHSIEDIGGVRLDEIRYGSRAGLDVVFSGMRGVQGHPPSIGLPIHNLLTLHFLLGI
jgi:hypothetical protein